jgi:hypothetical protein
MCECVRMLNHGKHGRCTEDTENGLAFLQCFPFCSVLSVILNARRRKGGVL